MSVRRLGGPSEGAAGSTGCPSQVSRIQGFAECLCPAEIRQHRRGPKAHQEKWPRHLSLQRSQAPKLSGHALPHNQLLLLARILAILLRLANRFLAHSNRSWLLNRRQRRKRRPDADNSSYGVNKLGKSSFASLPSVKILLQPGPGGHNNLLISFSNLEMTPTSTRERIRVKRTAAQTLSRDDRRLV